MGAVADLDSLWPGCLQCPPMQKPLPPFTLLVAVALFSLIALDCPGESGPPNAFTRLEQIPKPRIAASAEAYPGGSYNARNIIDGKVQTEYSSNGKGTDTFIEFDFGSDRRD